MPRKNVTKTFVEDGYYHIYNRGIEKRTIFQDENDYKIFLTQIKNYVTPPPDIVNLKQNFSIQGNIYKGLPHQNKNYHQEIRILCYALMPNHFHILVNQRSRNGISNFMRSLQTKYTMYFNKKYDRIGNLFQGTYKAVLITQDYYLLHLSRYLHRNPIDLTPNLTRAYTSYANYIQPHIDDWVHTRSILSFFDQPTLPFMGKKMTYQSFVENYELPSHQQKKPFQTHARITLKRSFTLANCKFQGTLQGMYHKRSPSVSKTTSPSSSVL